MHRFENYSDAFLAMLESSESGVLVFRHKDKDIDAASLFSQSQQVLIEEINFPRLVPIRMLRKLSQFFPESVDYILDDIREICDVLGQNRFGEVSAEFELTHSSRDTVRTDRFFDELFHVDTVRQDVDREFLRIVMIYLGNSTQWVESSFVARDTLRMVQRKCNRWYGAVASESEIAELINTIFVGEYRIESVPHSYALLLRGGCSRGLIHRVPPYAGPRVVLRITTGLLD
jgi:hypothetical protein